MSRLLVADGEAWGLVRLKIGCFTTLFYHTAAAAATRTVW